MEKKYISHEEMNALATAAKTNDCDTLTHILDKWPSAVNLYVSTGNGVMTATLLHQAARSGSMDAVKLLVDRGAELNLTETLENLTPLGLAVIQRQYAVAHYLLEKGASPNSEKGYPPLLYAAMSGSKEMTDALAAHGADLGAISTLGKNLLHHVFLGENCNLDILAWVIQERPKLVQMNDWIGTPILQIALDGQAPEQAIKMLIAAGADVQAEDKTYKSTPLHYLGQNVWQRKKNSSEYARLLVSEGAPVDVTNSLGITPLAHIAKLSSQQPNNEGYLPLAKTLLELGANPHALDIEGKNALDHAGSSPVQELLSQWIADQNARAMQAMIENASAICTQGIGVKTAKLGKITLQKPKHD